jgi:hypothetical protein
MSSLRKALYRSAVLEEEAGGPPGSAPLRGLRASPELKDSEAGEGPKRASCRRAVLLLLAPLLLYGVALNPYFLPSQYDDILYYYGAKSLAENGSYRFNGLHITDWPPVLPALLAVLFLAGLESVWAAKSLILLFAGLGLLLTYRLFEREGRPHALTVGLLFALLPSSFTMGTRIMAEWPYIAVSFLFLILLDLLKERRRSIPFAVLTGCALGVASLTRWAGAFLGAAVLAQAFAQIRGPNKKNFTAEGAEHAEISRAGRGCAHFGALRSLRSLRFVLALPEAVVAITGACIFGLWRAKIALELLAGTAEASENWGPLKGIIYFDPVAELNLFNDLFFGGLNIVQYFGVENHPITLILVLPVLITVAGMVSHFRSNGLRPADWYVLVTLIVLTFYYDLKLTRYLLPIAPFLLSYLFTGAALTARALKVKADLWSTWPFKVALAAWMAMLVTLDGYGLIYGNTDRTHFGLCVLASPKAESFYAGEWRDLYQMCHFMREDPAPGPVAVVGSTDGIGKYILAFSGRPYKGFPPQGEARFVIARSSSKVPEEAQKAFGLVEVKRSQNFTLYRVAPAALSGRNGDGVTSARVIRL